MSDYLYYVYVRRTSGHSDQAVESDIMELMTKSYDAMKFSYSPYSKFSVGAAVLCRDGTVYTGTCR